MKAKFKNGIILEGVTLAKIRKESILSAPFKPEYLPIFTEDNLGSFQLLTDSEEVVKDFSASVIGSKTKIENNTIYIAYETDDTDEILSQNQADIDAINEAIASLAEIVGGTAE